jgi:hypothetical protein
MKVAAVLMIGLALLIGLVPQFTSCESQGSSLTLANGRQIPMKCHWTAQAEVALAAPLGLTGLLLAFSKRKETQRMLSIIGVALGAFVIMLPTALIGVCGNPEMICNAIMKPTLILSGALVIGVSGIGVTRTYLQKEATAWASSP